MACLRFRGLCHIPSDVPDPLLRVGRKKLIEIPDALSISREELALSGNWFLGLKGSGVSIRVKEHISASSSL